MQLCIAACSDAQLFAAVRSSAQLRAAVYRHVQLCYVYLCTSAYSCVQLGATTRTTVHSCVQLGAIALIRISAAVLSCVHMCYFAPGAPGSSRQLLAAPLAAPGSPHQLSSAPVSSRQLPSAPGCMYFIDFQ